jgi:hypothetical protein
VLNVMPELLGEWHVSFVPRTDSCPATTAKLIDGFVGKAICWQPIRIQLPHL